VDVELPELVAGVQVEEVLVDVELPELVAAPRAGGGWTTRRW